MGKHLYEYVTRRFLMFNDPIKAGGALKTRGKCEVKCLEDESQLNKPM